MARMHSRKKGAATSTRPVKRTHPGWVRYKPKEIEMIILKMSKEGKTMAHIGLDLRDVYGIPDVKRFLGKSISHFLKEKGMTKALPEDMANLIRQALVIRKHMERNNKDMPALRGLQLCESKVKRLAKYYKRTKKLPLDWKYDPETASRYLE